MTQSFGNRPRFSRSALGVAAVLAFALALLAPTAAEAQPWGGWAIYGGTPAGWVEIPHSPALNPTGGFTVEGWIAVASSSGCDSIIGKDWQTAWWLGVCNNTLRSYIRGSSSQRNGGIIPNGEWTHIAVTWDGARRKHYINGELAGDWAEAAPPTTNSEPVQIGRDVSWGNIPDADINRFRLWNVGRSEAQIRATINVPQDSPRPGLVAVWGAGGTAIVGPHAGSIVGDLFALTFPVGTGCTPTVGGTTLCLHDRFWVNVDWETGSDSGPGTVAPLITNQSGVFWFFNPTNWEVMVKILNGCGLNNRWWMFSAATTNVRYRMTVFDIPNGEQKIYFNYPGPPAPAVTDVSAFATCP